MVRVLLSRRWLGALAVAAAFAVAAFLLGRWQWSRHEGRVAEVARVEAHYEAAPVPLADVLPGPTAALLESQEWRRVRVEGRYAAEAQLLVRNRPRDGVYGYEVAVPLVLDSGGALLVDRGWVPSGPSAAVPPTVPAPPAGVVTVTGWLRPGEEALGRDLPAGQLASVGLAAASRATGIGLYAAYLAAESEAVGSGAGVTPLGGLDPPDRSEGAHLAYAIQWWAALPVGFVLVLLGARREWLEGRGAASSRASRRGSGDGGPGAEGRRPLHGSDGRPVARARPGSAPVEVKDRPRKVRIWDEEDA